MQLTTQSVARFKGGQMEIQNRGASPCLYRGEIETIEVENNTLSVKFSWLARAEGFPHLPGKWIKDDTLSSFLRTLEHYSASDIGSDDIGGDTRICLLSRVEGVGEIIVLYPPNGSKLDPALVEGLELTKATRKPFHQSIVDAIERCSSPSGVLILFQLIKDTEIFTDHDKIIAAVDNSFNFPGGGKWAREIREVKESILAQKNQMSTKQALGT